MLIRKKRTSILSLPEGSNSVINDIKSIEKSVIITDRNRNKKIKNIEIEEFFYDVFFNVDIGKIVGMGIYDLEYQILKSPISNGATFFKNLESSDSVNINAALYGAKKDNIRRKKEETSSKLIKSGLINLKKEIIDVKNRSKRNNNKSSNNLGFVMSHEIESVEKLKRKGKKDLKLSQIQTQTTNREMVDHNKRFKSSYIDNLNLGVDPSFSLYPIVNTNSSNPNSMGEYFVKKIQSGIYETDTVLNTTRSKFENISSKPLVTINDLDLKNTKNTSVLKKSINRLRRIKCSFTLTSEQVNFLNNFTLSIKVRSKDTNLITEILNITILHSINVENYYIPDKIPIITSSRNSFYKIDESCPMVLNLSSIDDKVYGAYVYNRKINEEQNLLVSTFSGDSLYENVRDGQKIDSKVNITPHELVLHRVCPITVKGLKISNFNSTALKGRMFNYFNTKIYATPAGNNIKISWSTDRSAIAGVSIYRKERGQNDWMPLSYTKNLLGKREGFTNDIEKVFIGEKSSYGCSNSSQGTEVDYLAVKNRPVMYRCRLFLKKGGDVFSKKIAVSSPVKKLDIVTIELSGLIKSRNDSSKKSLTNSASDLVNPEKASVSFNIDFNMLETSTDKVLSILRSIGNEDIFSTDIDKLKSNLSDLILFGVTRLNTTTCESNFLGYFQSGLFEDNGDTWSAPSLGMSYKYYVEAYIVNTEIMDKSRETSVSYNKNVVSSVYDIMSPSGILKIQNTVVDNIPDTALKLSKSDVLPLNAQSIVQNIENSYAISNIQKSFSKDSLLSGMIRSTDSFSQDFDLGEYRTGDISTISAALVESKFSIKSDSSTVTTRSSKGYPVLRFTIVAEGLSQINKIDYIVITCQRNGQKSICGTCHNDGSGKIVFIDYINKDYIGQVSYSATPVLNNGIVLSSTVIVDTVLNEMYPKKKIIGE